MKFSCLQCMFIANEAYKHSTRYHISYSLNGRTSAVLHCIKMPKRRFHTPLNADSNGGICFLLRCVKPELCQVIVL